MSSSTVIAARRYDGPHRSTPELHAVCPSRACSPASEARATARSPVKTRPNASRRSFGGYVWGNWLRPTGAYTGRSPYKEDGHETDVVGRAGCRLLRSFSECGGGNHLPDRLLKQSMQHASPRVEMAGRKSTLPRIPPALSTPRSSSTWTGTRGMSSMSPAMTRARCGATRENAVPGSERSSWSIRMVSRVLPGTSCPRRLHCYRPDPDLESRGRL